MPGQGNGAALPRALDQKVMHFSRIFSVLLCFAAPGAISQTTLSNQHALSIDDMMSVEDIGAATIDPTGRWLIYERLRPYDQFDDYSFRTYAQGKTGHQLWRYDLRNGGPPGLLPGIDPRPHSFVQGFSRSGRFLAIMQYRFGNLSLGAYDVARARTVLFRETPAFSKDGSHNPVWVSDSEMIFAALPEGTQPRLTSLRAHSGRALARAWEDAWRGKTVTASEVRTMSEDQSGQQEPGRLVRADTQTGRSEILAQGLYADLRVSPDRQRLAALAVSRPRPSDPNKLREDDLRRYRLTIFDLGNGRKRLYAPDLEFFPYTMAWAPDGRHLAAYGWKSGEGPRDGRFYVVDTITGAVVRYDHIGLDLASEQERGWLQRPERTVFLGDGLAVFARPVARKEDQGPQFTYKSIRPIGLPKPDWYLLSPDGTSRNLTKDLPGVSGIPVHAGDDHLAVVADDGVYKLYRDGRRVRLTPALPGRFTFPTPGTFATRDSVVRPEFADEGLFQVADKGTARIVMVDFRDGRDGKAAVVDAPGNRAIPLAGSLSAGTILFRAEDGAISRLFLANVDAGAPPREIARINARLAEAKLGSWQLISYEVKDPEGKQPPQTIESCLLLPPDYAPGALPPVVVEVYPGIGPNCKDGAPRIDPYSVNWSPYLWAGRGFAYARLSAPRQLIRTSSGPIAGMPDLINAGVDALVARHLADPSRVGLIGFSQGGEAALYVAANSNRFKAVIAMNSWTDFFSHYFGANGLASYVYGENFGQFRRYDSTSASDTGIGRTPFEDPEAYYRNSPVFLAPRISAPVLLIHSDMDTFSMSQFDEMYGALLRSGKDARYVRYWGEGHGPSSPANIRDLWRRMDGFLKENGVGPAGH